MCFLSGDNRINEKMAQNRNIDFYYSRGIDKASFVEQFTAKYKAAASEMLYIGDDLFDLSMLQAVGHPYCTADSPAIVKNACFPAGVVPRKGGENVIAEMKVNVGRDVAKLCKPVTYPFVLSLIPAVLRI